MNELIKIQYDDDRPSVLGRELHEFLEVESNYTTWFKRMCEYGFIEVVDFIPILEESTGGRPTQNHKLTFEMAKELCMLQRTEKGKIARQYFIQLEKDWNSPEKVMARALLLANKEIQKLTLTVSEMKPKAEFFDAVAESKDAIPMDKVAKVLNYKGYGRNRLFEFLRDKKVLMANNIPYQKYVDCGYFRVVEQKYSKPNGEVCVNIKTLVYQKGINFIKRLLDNEN